MATDFEGQGTPSTTTTTTDLDAAKGYLAEWLQALSDAKTQYYMSGRTHLQRARVDECLRMVKHWQSEVSRLTAGRRQGAREEE